MWALYVCFKKRTLSIMPHLTVHPRLIFVWAFLALHEEIVQARFELEGCKVVRSCNRLPIQLFSENLINKSLRHTARAICLKYITGLNIYIYIVGWKIYMSSLSFSFFRFWITSSLDNWRLVTNHFGLNACKRLILWLVASILHSNSWYFLQSFSIVLDIFVYHCLVIFAKSRIRTAEQNSIFRPRYFPLAFRLREKAVDPRTVYPFVVYLNSSMNGNYRQNHTSD